MDRDWVRKRGILLFIFMILTTSTQSYADPTTNSESEKNTQISSDNRGGENLISQSPLFNGASTSISATNPLYTPNYPIEEHDLFGLSPNSFTEVNPMVKPYLTIATSDLLRKRELVLASSSALLDSFIMFRKASEEYRIKKRKYDSFLFNYYLEGSFSLFELKGNVNLRTLSDIDYLITKNKESLLKAEGLVENKENNFQAVYANYNSLNSELTESKNWVNLLLTVNDDIGNSEIPLSTLKFILNQSAKQSEVNPCSCNQIVNFKGSDFYTVSKMERFAQSLGFKVEIVYTLNTKVNDVPEEIISTRGKFLRNYKVNQGEIKVSGLSKKVTQFNQGFLEISPTNMVTNYPTNKVPELEIEGSEKLKYYGLKVSSEDSNYGPSSILMNYSDFQKIAKVLNSRATYKLILVSNNNNLINKPEQYNIALWRARNYGSELGLVEENVSWSPSYWEFLDNQRASQLVGNQEYLLTDSQKVVMEKPESVISYSIPILKSVNCSKFMREPLASSLLLIKFYGLGALINTSDFGGCYAAKIIEGYSTLSYHARGMAVDLNVHGNLMGAEGDIDSRVVNILNYFGLRWGGYWNRKDPMHFELASILDMDKLYNTSLPA